ncbi:unnamed protein product [Clavelina lepadiformis]|uniref:Proteasome activator PA28 C-terminal domain-containing protein n=1 Tax=Clavelina lepadiformis TaxID=159417 RepID=A0ABP0F8T7_CLALP
MDRLRAEITGLIDYCNILRLWVTLLLPKIEDGNNFGRSVQEETVNEVQNAECELALYLSQISNYFSSRAKIATKIIKNPHVQDYYRYIAEEDEKQFVNFRLMLVDIRNTYSSIHDLILKNIEKIKRPRNSNYGSMY